MDQKVTDLIARLETSTQQLLMRYDQLQQECVTLQEQIRRKEEEILSLQEQNRQLQDKYDHLRMAKYIDMADDNVKDLRGRIRKMVRDIDQCISMLKVVK